MWRHYSLTVGLPHTNFRNLAERKLLMEAGNFFWRALGEAIGRPVSQLRSATGEPVYATIFFVEERVPVGQGLETFRLDDRLRFYVGLRFFGNRGVEARVMFDRDERFTAAYDPASSWHEGEALSHPAVRFGSLFASVDRQRQALVPVPPVHVSCDGLPQLPMEEHPAHITRQAQQTGHLDLIPEYWVALDPTGASETKYAIDPDRDTNAAGLVYFASYVAWLEMGERQAIPLPTSTGNPYTRDTVSVRRLLRRRIAYYGNASMSDQVTIAARRFAPPDDRQTLGLRYRVTRETDGALLCLSEALFSLTPRPAAVQNPIEISLRVIS